MIMHAKFGPSSMFIDVGSGLGKPNLHVMDYPGVAFSFGIEQEEGHRFLSLIILYRIVQENHNELGYKCMFDLGNIENVQSSDPFTHVYMFSTG